MTKPAAESQPPDEADTAPAPVEQPLLHCDDVHFAYHRHAPVLAGITGTIQPGKVTALLGPNAAGKTTLLKLLLGQLRPTRGRVMLEGQPVHTLKTTTRARRLSYVPQQSHSQFGFPVVEVVRMGRFAQADDPEAVDTALAACDLTDLRDRPFVELSAGQQQRVLLARAMAQASGSGRMLLADEPTASMDLAWSEATMHRLRGLAAGGLAVVVVVHDLNLASRYADHVWLLHEGRLAASGNWWHVCLPEVLEPVYGLPLRIVQADDQDRPVFIPGPDASAFVG